MNNNINKIGKIMAKRKKIKERDVINFFSTNEWFDTFYAEAYKINSDPEFAAEYASQVPCDVEILQEEAKQFISNIEEFKKTSLYNQFKNEQLLWVNAFYQNTVDYDGDDEDILAIKNEFSSKEDLLGFLSSMNIDRFFNNVSDIQIFSKVAEEIFGIKREGDVEVLCKNMLSPCTLTELEKCYMPFMKKIESFYADLEFLNVEMGAEAMLNFSFMDYTIERDGVGIKYIMSPLSNKITQSMFYFDFNDAFNDSHRKEKIMQYLKSVKYDEIKEKLSYINDNEHKSDVLKVLLDSKWDKKKALNGDFIKFLNEVKHEVSGFLFTEVVSDFISTKMLENEDVYNYYDKESLKTNNCLDGIEIAKKIYIKRIANFNDDLFDEVNEIQSIRVVNIQNIEKLKKITGHKIVYLIKQISSPNFEVKFENEKNDSLDIIMKGNDLDLLTKKDIDTIFLSRIKKIVDLETEYSKKGELHTLNSKSKELAEDLDKELRETILNIQLRSVEKEKPQANKRKKI